MKGSRFLAGFTAGALLFGSIVFSGVVPEISLSMGQEMVASAATSGTCGDNLTWTLESGVLTISGTGEMEDYTSEIAVTDSGEISTDAAPWYSNRESIISIVIENGVTSIGNDAFYRCTSLTSITIPDSVTSIGYDAFYYCTSLTSITLPDSVTSIESWTFSNCTSLTSITIPDSVTSIRQYAFRNTALLNNQDGPIYYVDGWVVETEEDITKAEIQDGTRGIAYMAFYGRSSLTAVTIPDSLLYICDRAFDWCPSLTTISMGNGVVRIGDGAFFYNISLTSLTLPNSLKEIGYRAFDQCISLQSITIPASVTSIGDGAFMRCESLTSITILNPDCEIVEEYYDTISNGDDEDYNPYYNGAIYGYQNSTAQAYAKKNGYTFVILAEKYISGVLDGDSAISITDAFLCLQAYANQAAGNGLSLTDAQKTAADVDGDGSITIMDAAYILQYYAGNAAGNDVTWDNLI